MTQEEKLAILADAEVRAYEAIKVWDGPSMASENFLHLLHAVDQMRWMQQVIAKPEQYDESDDFAAPVTPKQDLDPAPEAKEPVKLDPIEEPKPIETPKEPTLTKADMIAKLTPYQSNGVDIGGVMKDMGYAKLSDVPAARYWELLENVQKAADGEG